MPGGGSTLTLHTETSSKAWRRSQAVYELLGHIQAAFTFLLQGELEIFKVIWLLNLMNGYINLILKKQEEFLLPNQSLSTPPATPKPSTFRKGLDLPNSAHLPHTLLHIGHQWKITSCQALSHHQT